jgi:hypothetical protein
MAERFGVTPAELCSVSGDLGDKSQMGVEMVRVPPSGGRDRSGHAAAALFFDPNAFPAPVAGVAWAFGGMETSG